MNVDAAPGLDPASRLHVADLGSEVTVSTPFPDNPPLYVDAEKGALSRDTGKAAEWSRSHRAALDGLLAHHGALVLRGFALPDTASFARFLGHYHSFSQGYAGGATPRDRVSESVYEATQVPPSVSILLHQEMAYLREYPKRIAFFCVRPADTGGETTVGDFRHFTRDLPASFVEKLTDTGVVYHRNFRPSDELHTSDPHPAIYHATLAQGFGTLERDRIEETCRLLGMEYEWEPDGSLSTRLAREAFARHPLTGQRVYFNHILTQIIDPEWLGDAYEPYLDMYDRAGRPRPYDVTYGDGSPVDMTDHHRVRDGLASITVAPTWQAGDVLLIDNILVGHGRTPFRGPRNVQVMLLD
jgi:alpha-ketoglutarate-dependent taurine dioxygenase